MGAPVVGASWRADRKKWRATIVVDGKQLSLGHHSSREEAQAAYDVAKAKYHGEFRRCSA